MVKHKYNVMYAVMSVAILALLVTACFVDGAIARKIFVSKSGISFIFDAIGKMPAFGIGGISCIILLICSGQKSDVSKVWLTILRIAYIVAGIGFFSLAFKDFMDMLTTGKLVYIGCLGLGMIVYVLMLLPMIKLRPQSVMKYKKWAFTSVVAVCFIAVTVMAIKLIWGRERFIDSMNTNNAIKLWLIPQRLGGESMPSGHVAFAASALLLLPLCKINVKLGNCEYKLLFLIVLYIIVVAISRMIAGAHYLSDVGVSMALVLLISFISNRISFGKSCDSLYFKQNGVFDKLF